MNENIDNVNFGNINNYFQEFFRSPSKNNEVIIIKDDKQDEKNDENKNNYIDDECSINTFISDKTSDYSIDSKISHEQIDQTSCINNDIYIKLLQKKIQKCNINNYNDYRKIHMDHQSHKSHELILHNSFLYRNISKAISDSSPIHDHNDIVIANNNMDVCSSQGNYQILNNNTYWINKNHDYNNEISTFHNGINNSKEKYNFNDYCNNENNNRYFKKHNYNNNEIVNNKKNKLGNKKSNIYNDDYYKMNTLIFPAYDIYPHKLNYDIFNKNDILSEDDEYLEYISSHYSKITDTDKTSITFETDKEKEHDNLKIYLMEEDNNNINNNKSVTKFEKDNINCFLLPKSEEDENMHNVMKNNNLMILKIPLISDQSFPNKKYQIIKNNYIYGKSNDDNFNFEINENNKVNEIIRDEIN
ncbi:hypothetical protein PIROE2DRAFT_3909, partial [Piromyces sp. E2]